MRELGIFLIIVIASASLFNFAPEKFPADDGFFYLQISCNISDGFGSTFHKIAYTNGYHPLWMIICTAASILNWDGKGFLIHIVWFIQLIIFLASIILFRRLTDRDNNIFLGESFLALIFIGLGTLYLLESHLNLLLLVIFLLYALRCNTYVLKDWLLLGIISSLYVLSRLDTFLVALPILGYAAIGGRGNIFKNSLIMILGGMIIVLPYLIVNYMYFEHLIPISGVVKSSFPHIRAIVLDFFGKVVVLTTILYLILLLTIFRERKHRFLLVALNIGNLLHLGYNALYSGTAQWYWVSQYLALASMLNDSFAFLMSKFQLRIDNRKLRFAIIILLVMPTFIFSFLKLKTNFGIANIIFKGEPLEMQSIDPVRSLAEKIDGLIPENSNLLVYDTPGRLAWYSHLNIFPVDGLINDFEYNDFIETNGIAAYLREKNISYMLTPYSNGNISRQKYGMLEFAKNGDDMIIDVYSPISIKNCGEIILGRDDLLFVEKSPLVTGQQAYPLIALWKMPGSVD